MKPKNTLILFILALAIFAFLRFYESKQPTTREAGERRQHVLAFDRDKIDGISITNNEGKIELRRRGAQWQIETPVKDRADAAGVNQLLTDIETLNVENSFKAGREKSSLKDFGLDAPGVRLKLLGKEAPAEILFGKDTAVEGKMYLRLEGSDTVYVVNNDLENQVQKKAGDFRDRRLLDFEPSQVTRLGIKSVAGEIEVSKDRGEWSLDKPLKARGDVQKITDLIAQTINTRIDTFLPLNGANLSAYGLNEPRGSIALTVREGGNPTILQIGQPVGKEKDKIYAKLSTRESVCILPDKIGEVLNVRPNDVRDKHLFKLNLDTVDLIHIEPAGKPKITLARKQEDWVLKTSGNAPANSALVSKFAADLQNRQITAFVSDVASDLPKYGLDKPSLKVGFSAFASENTAESKAGESPILTVAFGKSEGNTVYARLESEPYVVSVAKPVLDSIFTDPALWQDLTIFKFKPDEITSVEIARDNKTIAIERSGNAGWKLTKGEGAPNQINAQSLVNTLSTLRAARWTGSSTNGLGLGKPALVISFGTIGKKSGRLTVGAATPDGMWNAVADGLNGAFLVNQPDCSALQLDLAATPSKPEAAGLPSAAPTGVK